MQVLKNLFYVVSALAMCFVATLAASGVLLLVDQLDSFRHESTIVFMAGVMSVVVCPLVIMCVAIFWSIRLMEKSDL